LAPGDALEKLLSVREQTWLHMLRPWGRYSTSHLSVQAVETKLGQALQRDRLPQKKAAAQEKKSKYGDSVKTEEKQTPPTKEELDVPLAERAKARSKRRKLPQSMQLQS